MRVVSIVAGAGSMYCGACLHASTLAVALRKAGLDAVLVPAYTPVTSDEEDGALERVVYGGLNVFLQEKSALARHTPWFLDRLLDRPGLLRWLGRRGGSTRPEGLGRLCVSMLRGEDGRQRKELEKLVDWLKRELRPDVVHLSTALLAGMARRIARALDVPVVATLSGEDTFVERLPEPHAAEARTVLRERCRELAGLVALNRYYAQFMAEYLGVDRERIHVIPPGLNLDGHRSRSDRRGREKSELESGGVTIGFFGRVCHDKGLHLLAEAFALLAGRQGLPPLRLVAAGYLADGDRGYLAGIAGRLAERGLAARFEYRGCLGRAEKIALLQSLDVMSMPTVWPESKGLPVLEAWANGVPVVVPAHGAFTELVADTGGGLLFAPQDPRALAAAIEQLACDPVTAMEMGRRGQDAVHDRYHAERMARQTAELYRTVLDLRRSGFPA
jgi:glycosyltransferase involved in cell wall biosynthesis